MLVRTAVIADAEVVAAIHVASWQSAFRGLMPQPLLDSRNPVKIAQSWRENILQLPGNLIVVEAVDGRVTGFACQGRKDPTIAPMDYEWQVFGIHVAPEEKGQGFGRALMQESFHRRDAAQCSHLCLWTLKENHAARSFYTQLGGVVVAESTRNFGGVDLPEIAYGWQR